MRTLILLAVIVSAYAADFASDPEVVAAIKARNEADDKLGAILQARVLAMGLTQLPDVKLSDDPTRSEEHRANVVDQYNNIAIHLERWRKDEMRTDWPAKYCAKVNEMLVLRAKIGAVPVAVPPTPKPKSQITATLPDGTVIKSDTHP